MKGGGREQVMCSGVAWWCLLCIHLRMTNNEEADNDDRDEEEGEEEDDDDDDSAGADDDEDKDELMINGSFIPLPLPILPDTWLALIRSSEEPSPL